MEPVPAPPSDAASETLILPESSTGAVHHLGDGGGGGGGGGGAVHVTCSTERLADTRAPPVARGADRLSDLPEHVLHHILSLLPARDAVRTCVLAQRWRNRWRSVLALRVDCYPGSHGVDGAFGRFVDGLLRARRGGPPLDSCEFDLDVVDSDSVPGRDFDDLELYGNTWIRRVLELNVRELAFRVYCGTEFPIMGMPDVGPLSSQHLTSLELVKSDIRDYNFSGCSVLERLMMERCDVNSLEMQSLSLKHLSITYCYFDTKSRIWMWFPSLVSFKFIDNLGRAPMLETMPHLETAIVGFDYDYEDKCKNGRLDDCGDAACGGCSNYYGPGGSGCVFLQGLAEATYLNLSAPPEMYVFNRDFKWCPAFYKLKTLVLSECFLSTDLSALIWFLHHTPLVEEFILHIPKGYKSLMKLEGSYNPLEKSIAPSRLQIVEIICKDVNGIVLQVLKVLNANGIPLWKIRIQCSGCYNFVCTDISM